MIHADFAYIADRTGERYKVDTTWTVEEIQKLFESIEKDYHLHNRLSYIRNSTLGIIIGTLFLN